MSYTDELSKAIDLLNSKELNIKSMTIEINGQDITLDLQTLKDLYVTLDKVFGVKQTFDFPTTPPSYPPFQPYDINPQPWQPTWVWSDTQISDENKVTADFTLYTIK